ncbi:polyprenyl synthetase family protein [Ligilactobacillus araffinosus]|uniref:Farnesyl diphosphate synthase n=1 Tax=Ligilactobacillus araffinosus DSM 20653 TaxID=1423820 RepID=A0A0R1ZB14_9LACO|nr:farnesyl diphosphate synthase [Ligilactobacillus araffinosus]KRM51873.1 Geranylgeranyl pyrophosphate synthase [Ligilactobacillus araffinosus DSM 20653]
MKNNQIEEFKQATITKIDQCLDEYLASLESYTILKDAMCYSVDAGGKRLRSFLILAICQTFKGKYSDLDLQVASSLELIHTYSLIHDDLPEMDNDDLRRGKPTNHKVYGQAMAVLAGDGLLTTAFEWLSRLELDPVIQVKLIHALSKAAGPEGMVNGQVGDIQGEQHQLTLAQLQRVHRGKTGALIQYACYAGGLLSNVSAEHQDALKQFGTQFGLAFQIYDDILDVVGTEAELGKKVHKDQAENKNTYPRLLGLEGAQKELRHSVQLMRESLAVLHQDGIDISLLADFLNYFKIKDKA